jgi:hypothetical protein
MSALSRALAALILVGSAMAFVVFTHAVAGSTRRVGSDDHLRPAALAPVGEFVSCMHEGAMQIPGPTPWPRHRGRLPAYHAPTTRAPRLPTGPAIAFGFWQGKGVARRVCPANARARWRDRTVRPLGAGAAPGVTKFPTAMGLLNGQSPHFFAGVKALAEAADGRSVSNERRRESTTRGR